jgi:hypothetical protein
MCQCLKHSISRKRNKKWDYFYHIKLFTKRMFYFKKLHCERVKIFIVRNSNMSLDIQQYRKNDIRSLHLSCPLFCEKSLQNNDKSSLHFYSCNNHLHCCYLCIKILKQDQFFLHISICSVNFFEISILQ